MQIRFLSYLSAAGLSFCLSLPVIAQSSPKPESVDLSTPTNLETVTEDTSSQESGKPTGMSDTPVSPNGNPSTSEAVPESNTRVQDLTNTTEEIEKVDSEAVESVESQTGEEIRPTIKIPETSVPKNLKK